MFREKCGRRIRDESLARTIQHPKNRELYIEALRAEASVVAAQGNVELAQASLKLAQDQRNAGIATGVDVTRAETRLAEQQIALAQAQTSSE